MRGGGLGSRLAFSASPVTAGAYCSPRVECRGWGRAAEPFLLQRAARGCALRRWSPRRHPAHAPCSPLPPSPTSAAPAAHSLALRLPGPPAGRPRALSPVRAPVPWSGRHVPAPRPGRPPSPPVRRPAPPAPAPAPRRRPQPLLSARSPAPLSPALVFRPAAPHSPAPSAPGPRARPMGSARRAR